MSDRTLKAVMVMEVAQWHEAARNAGDDLDTLEAKLRRLDEAASDTSGTDKLVSSQEKVRDSSGKTSEAVDDVGRSIQELDHQQLSLTPVETALGKVAEDASVKGEQIGRNLGDGIGKGVQDIPEKIKPTTEKLPTPFGPAGDKAGATFAENFKKHHDDFVTFAASLSKDFYDRFKGDSAAALDEVNNLFNRRLADGAYDGATIFSKGFATRLSSGKGDELSTWLGKMLPGAAKSGDEAGGVFGNGIVGGATNAFKILGSMPPEAQAAIIAWAVAVGVLASSFIAATISAALLGAAGTLGLAAGIAAEAKDPRIAAAFARLKSDAADTLTGAAHEFVTPVENAIDTLDEALHKGEPDLQRWFDALSPSIERLANGAGILVDDVLAGLADSGEADALVLNQLADILPMIGTGIKIFLDEIKGGGQGAADGLKLIAIAIVGILIAAGGILEVFSMIFQFVDSGVEDTVGMVKLLVDVLAKIYPSWKPIASAVDSVAASLARTTGASKGAADATDRYGTSAQQAATSAQSLSDAIEQNTTDYDNLVGANLSAASSALQFQNSLAALSKAAQDNGTSLDTSTAAGRANTQSLLDAENAARSAADAIRQQTANTEGATAGDYAYSASLGNSAAALYKSATAAGFNKDAVAQMISKMLGIPASVITQYLAPGGAGVQALIDYINSHAVDKTVDIVYNERHYTSYQQVQPGHGGNDPGGFLGTIHHAAAGGVFDAGVYSDGPIMFAEPQTGGEAFIPRMTSDPDRARAVTEQAAAWHGGHVQWGNGPVQHAPVPAGAGGGYASASEMADRLAQRLAPLVGNITNNFNQVEADANRIGEAVFWSTKKRG